MSRTADEIISSVQLTVTMPTNQSLLTDARILSFADEEIESRILLAIDSINQNYLIKTYSVAVTSATASYPIPERAIGRTLRDLKITDGAQIRNLALIALEDAHFYNYSATPNGFYFLGDKVVLVPAPSGNYTLLMYALERPGRFIQVSGCGTVTAINSNVITVDAVPSTFAVGSKCDFIEGIAGNSTLETDEPITAISGNDITFATVPTDLAIGDYIAPQYRTPVMQIPEEAFSLLVSLTSIRCLKAIGDIEGASTLEKDIPEKMRAFEMLIAPRIQGETIKVIQRVGLLRGNRSRFRRGLIYP